MNNNINMAGMGAMGGPVGGGMPMMNNGAPGARPTMPDNVNQRSQLNTYIYEYFLRNGMYDCARSLLKSDQPMNVLKDSAGRRREENGVGEEGADGESKDDIDPQRPADLPDPNLPKECPESCFLYEWWCLFWDMFNAQRGKGDGRNILQYVSHTQAQSRVRQEQQQAMLQGLRNTMVPNQRYQQMIINQQNGMGLNQETLRQKAMQNRGNGPQMAMLAQQQKMQRDPSDGNNQRAQSPGSAENAPSPSKRPRLDGAPFNPQQMNGRGQGGGIPQQVGESGPNNAIQAAHMQLNNGIESNSLTAQQFQNMPGNANQQARISGYQANLVQQQQGQMASVKPMPNAGGPQNQGSPMMTQGPDGGAIANYYNPGQIGANGLRNEPGGPAGGGGNHALQDYQMQLMLLEQQNKKRLMMARQEQDNLTPNRPGEGVPGQPGGVPGQAGFQSTSPQGPRSVNSPNPGDQMKRQTPHMNPVGIPSPIPEGQNRGSPNSAMNFNMQGAQMDPNMNPQYFMKNGMDQNMAMANGMRPPSSHPGGGFNNQMAQQQQQQQQMAMVQRQQVAQQQQQQQQQQQAAVANWQQGSQNGQMMQQPSQGGGPQQGMGTPQQRAMPPPPAVAPGPAVNGRTASPQQNPAPPTPQQANKAAPKKKNESKESKAKRAAKKGTAANLNAGATPSADAENAGATPTPATPVTPMHPKSFNNSQNGVVQPVTNGQPPAPAASAGVPTQQPDSLQGGAFGLGDSYDFQGGMDFANPTGGNMDVLQDFDFDSFLHQDGEGVSDFTFDGSAFMDGGEIGAE